jgi:hypothetical protein
MVEFATAAFSYEAESLAWQRAYWELDGKYRDTLDGFEKRLAVIGEKHDGTVAAYEKELAKARRRERLPSFGVFAGAGYSGGGVGPVIGVGVVWKIF